MKFQSKIKQIEKERIALLAGAKKLQDQFINALIDFYVNSLDFDGNNLSATSANTRNARKLRRFSAKFSSEFFKPFLEKTLKSFTNILSNNNLYFKRLTTVDNKIRDKVLKQTMAEIGVNVIDGKLFLDPEGWLKSLDLTNTDDVYRRVRQIASQAAKNQVSITDFKKQLNDYVRPNNKLGPIMSKIYTNANDSFAQFDRLVTDDYAKEVGLVFFRYQGGEVDGSRAFCIGGVDKKTGRNFKRKNGVIFHIDEVYEDAEWLGDWSGKRSDGATYDPLRDLGDWGCRHFKDYVSNKRALRERPELERYL